MKQFFLGSCLLLSLFAHAQQRKTENVVIVTLDGMRWQEIFGGVDSSIMNDPKYTKHQKDLSAAYWDPDTDNRRKKLFPFFWGFLRERGQLYGNRARGNLVNVSNPYQFSYPGYNEIFTGYPDTAVNSNDKVINKNTNVLEFINGQKGYGGKVAVFSTWDAFPYILNRQRNGIYMNSDTDSLSFGSREFRMINDMQFLAPQPLAVRPDLLTFFAARQYLKEFRPRVLYLAWDETDDYAHAGLYDQYINSAHAEDKMLADLWSTLQSMPGYKDRTTLIVTCDHGRGGKIKDQWRDHGADVEGSGAIWMAVIGPDTRASGEMTQPSQLYQKQWAPTIAALLGLSFRPDQGSADPVRSVLE